MLKFISRFNRRCRPLTEQIQDRSDNFCETPFIYEA